MKNRILFTLALSTIFSLFAQAEDMDAFWSSLNNERVESEKTIVWEQVGPGNAGFANLLRFHPTIPGWVSTCPDMWNAYQSENNGTSWYGITDYDGDASFFHLHDLYYSPKDPEQAVAITGSRFFHSVDTGRTWQLVRNCPWYVNDGTGDDKEGWKKKISAVGIDPNDSQVWYVGGGSFVRGQEWKSCYQTVTLAKPHGLELGKMGKMWRTDNGGTSWTSITSGLNAKAQIGRIIVNPKNSNQVFAATNYGLYRSENKGGTWSQISSGKLESDIIMDMDFYYNTESGKFILYVIDQVQYLADGNTTKCQGGIFSSDDNGDTWTKMNGNLGLDYNRISGGAPDNYYKFIAVWFGISKTDAKSTYPNLPTEGMQFFNMISADPSREGAVYVGMADPQTQNSIVPGRLWVTDNHGKKWTNTARLYEHVWRADGRYWDERGNPTHLNMEVGHSSPHMQSGNNYALRSMRALDVGVDGSVMIISDHSTMLSTDHGATWKQVDEDYTPDGNIIGRGNSNLPGLEIAQDKRLNHMVLGSGEHKVWIPTNDSPDSRQALKFIEDAQETVISIAFDPYDATHVYGTSSRQADKQYIYHSTNEGYNWEKWGVATPATNKWLDDFYTNSLLINPIDNNYMYHGITRIVDTSKGELAGFYYSSDNGKTFTQSRRGLPSPVRISDIEFDPRDNTRKSLFAAAQQQDFDYTPPLAEGGLFHSSDHGASWTSVNLPSAVKGVQEIHFDHTNRLYITTGYRSNGAGVWYSDNFGDSWTQIFKGKGTVCFDVSPFDNNFLVVSMEFLEKNPGVYVSRDRGATWHKSNTGIVTLHRIEDIEFSIYNSDEIWIANLGTGFYKGRISGDIPTQAVNIEQNSMEAKPNDTRQLNASIVDNSYASSKILWKSENPAIVEVDANGKLTYKSHGNTKVWATTEDGRYTDYCVVVCTDTPSALASAFAKKEISIAPSLVEDRFSVLGVADDCLVRIFNMDGALLCEYDKSFNIDVSHFESGCYLVQINNQQLNKTLTMIKK